MREAEGDLWSEGLVAVADDGGDTGHGCEFVWGALGIAAGDDDAGSRVEAMGAADEGAGGAIGFGGDAAGVDDHDVCCGGVAFVESGGAQTAAYRFAIGARGPASEMLDVKLGHGFSLVPLLTRLR